MSRASWAVKACSKSAGSSSTGRNNPVIAGLVMALLRHTRGGCFNPTSRAVCSIQAADSLLNTQRVR